MDIKVLPAEGSGEARGGKRRGGEPGAAGAGLGREARTGEGWGGRAAGPGSWDAMGRVGEGGLGCSPTRLLLLHHLCFFCSLSAAAAAVGPRSQPGGDFCSPTPAPGWGEPASPSEEGRAEGHPPARSFSFCSPAGLARRGGQLSPAALLSPTPLPLARVLVAALGALGAMVRCDAPAVGHPPKVPSRLLLGLGTRASERKGRTSRTRRVSAPGPRSWAPK